MYLDDQLGHGVSSVNDGDTMLLECGDTAENWRVQLERPLASTGKCPNIDTCSLEKQCTYFQQVSDEKKWKEKKMWSECMCVPVGGCRLTFTVISKMPLSRNFRSPVCGVQVWVLVKLTRLQTPTL